MTTKRQSGQSARMSDSISRQSGADEVRSSRTTRGGGHSAAIRRAAAPSAAATASNPCAARAEQIDQRISGSSSTTRTLVGITARAMGDLSRKIADIMPKLREIRVTPIDKARGAPESGVLGAGGCGRHDDPCDDAAAGTGLQFDGAALQHGEAA